MTADIIQIYRNFIIFGNVQNVIDFQNLKILLKFLENEDNYFNKF